MSIDSIAPPEIIGHCWHCGGPFTAADYGRENACLGCGKATRSCRNCRNYARGRAHDCLEPIAEPVADKQRANFCEHFEPLAGAAGDPTRQPPDLLRAAADDLFK